MAEEPETQKRNRWLASTNSATHGKTDIQTFVYLPKNHHAASSFSIKRGNPFTGLLIV